METTERGDSQGRGEEEVVEAQAQAVRQDIEERGHRRQSANKVDLAEGTARHQAMAQLHQIRGRTPFARRLPTLGSDGNEGSWGTANPVAPEPVAQQAPEGATAGTSVRVRAYLSGVVSKRVARRSIAAVPAWETEGARRPVSEG